MYIQIISNNATVFTKCHWDMEAISFLTFSLMNSDVIVKKLRVHKTYGGQWFDTTCPS